MKVKITKIAPGKEVQTKYGLKSKIGFQCEEYGDKWINGFANQDTAKWQVGGEYELDITEDPKWGLQFKTVKSDPTEAIKALEARIQNIENKLGIIHF